MAYRVCITGAVGTLGKAFAKECASRGWDLFLTDLSEAQWCTVQLYPGRHQPVRALGERFGHAGLGGLDDQAAVGENSSHCRPVRQPGGASGRASG